ncbi:thioesterase II family protein [Amycolatopsis sp. EV170708-02-1]|uniref:thioesterase II family protein n=1 Tax=Amycolatopsis sp. EV170708-02-1 TaxID=2919322 RepID=UPI001F0C9687|nr:alpha/beta fold hydrolase [Amycolatopsis sp. EV170708-02-1]UMP03430.1 alpha/beta fold hydrolase [Amycolatopsis sp. EV170708-02-1]
MKTVLSPLSTIDIEGGRRRTYLCFPPAGATVLCLRGIARFSVGCEVWGVEYPGRGEHLTEPPAESLGDLADRITQDILVHFGAERLSRTVLIGFSMGAFVAHEVAQRVHSRARTAPAALVVVGACAPQRRVPGRYAEMDAAEVERLLDRTGLTPAAGYRDSPELREYAVDLLLGDLRLMSEYAGPAKVMLSCPIVAIRGDDDPAFAAGEEEVRAWQAWTSGRFTGVAVPGGHLGILKPGREAEFWSCVRRPEPARQGAWR